MRRKIEDYVDIGLSEGHLVAKAIAPGGAAPYVEPHLFEGIAGASSRLAREEVFGPVLLLFHAEATFDAALHLALDSEFALTGGLFSRNPANVEYTIRRISASGISTSIGR